MSVIALHSDTVSVEEYVNPALPGGKGWQASDDNGLHAFGATRDEALTAYWIARTSDKPDAVQMKARQLPAIQHVAASMMVTEVERVISSGVLSFEAETRLRVKTDAFCRECNIMPIWHEENASLADLDSKLAAIERQMGAP